MQIIHYLIVRINGFNNFKPDLLIIDLNLKLKKNLRFIKILKKEKLFNYK